jgi:glycosyltransferase involved in cell wall biosynthesis
MNVIFVGGSITGGSGMSQREFARALAGRGHRISTLAYASRSRGAERWCYGQLLARTQRSPIPAWLRPVFRPIYGLFGRRPSTQIYDDFHHWTSPVPENAFRRLSRKSRPDVVVVRSMRSRSIRELCLYLDEVGIPWVYLVAESLAIDQLAESGRTPAIAIATARSHERRLQELGFPTTFVPQMRIVTETMVESTRQVALLINPIEMLGVETVWPLAAARPDIEFVLQESWPLSDDDLGTLQSKAASLPNVTIRRFQTDRRKLYEDARVLLTPHRVDNNPRVAIEAHANGIPVLSSDQPGLLEVVGRGGLTVPVDADPEAWVAALSEMWDNPDRYDELCDEARLHYQHPDNDLERTVDRFEHALNEAAGVARQQ